MEWITINGCSYSLENNLLRLKNRFFTYAASGVEQVTAFLTDRAGRCVPFAEVVTGERNYRLWPELPAVWMSNPPETVLRLKGEHWSVRSIRLNAYTDGCDTLVTENEFYLFRNRSPKVQGNIFFLENRAKGEAIVLISETPDYILSELVVEDNAVHLQNGGNSLVVGFCRFGEGCALCRDYGRHIHLPELPFAMSNTWGDGNGARRVCHDFIIREIDAAAVMGLDVVQIDDGWQKGRTNDPAIFDEQHRRCFEGAFWEPDAERFPYGMKAVADYAAARGIRLGLWFAPDSHGEYQHFERDLAVLKKAYQEWGIRCFKLDMFWAATPAEQRKITAFIEAIHGFGRDVSVQMDITRPQRLNYLYAAEYGNVFVENRYTKNAGYYPHRTLRNFWSLARCMPAARLQFEIPNPDLNKDAYPANDPLAPGSFSLDYLFATVMLGLPLFWMELQFLSPARRAELARLMPVWKEHRERLRGADILPIGERPNGKSICGFLVRKGRKNTHLLLLREVSEAPAAMIPLPARAHHMRLLASNTEVSAEMVNGAVRVKLDQPRSYAFYELSDIDE